MWLLGAMVKRDARLGLAEESSVWNRIDATGSGRFVAEGDDRRGRQTSGQLQKCMTIMTLGSVYFIQA